jgi:hypothetical protein
MEVRDILLLMQADHPRHPVLDPRTSFSTGARALDADLLAFGAYGHPVAEVVVGEATRDTCSAPPCPSS